MEKLNTKKDLVDFISKSDEKLVVIKFSADWCGPCKQLGSVIDNLDIDEVIFGEVNVDTYPDNLDDYGIRSIPLLVFYRDGMIIDKTVGSMTSSDLKNKIKDNLNK